jgi:peroxin-19
MSSKPTGKLPATSVTIDDDEDVDDLDGMVFKYVCFDNRGSLLFPADVLEEFSKPSTAKAKPPSSTQPPVVSSSVLDDHSEPTEAELEAIEASFAAELAAGMEALMKGLSGPSVNASSKGDPVTEERELDEAFAKMLMQEGVPGASKVAGSNTSSGPPPPDFQKTVREAVERLKNSDETLKVGRKLRMQ